MTDKLNEFDFGDAIKTKARGLLRKHGSAAVANLADKTGGIFGRAPVARERISNQIITDNFTDHWLQWLARQRRKGSPREGNADDMREYIEQNYGADALQGVEPAITKIAGPPTNASPQANPGAAPQAPGPTPGPQGAAPGGMVPPTPQPPTPGVPPNPQAAQAAAARPVTPNAPSPSTATQPVGPGQPPVAAVTPPQGVPAQPPSQTATTPQSASQPVPNAEEQPPVGASPDEVRQFHTDRKQFHTDQQDKLARNLGDEINKGKAADPNVVQDLETKRREHRQWIANHQNQIDNPSGPSTAAPGAASASPTAARKRAPTRGKRAPLVAPAAGMTPPAKPLVKPANMTGDDGLSIPAFPTAPKPPGEPQVPDFLARQRNTTRPRPDVPRFEPEPGRYKAEPQAIPTPGGAKTTPPPVRQFGAPNMGGPRPAFGKKPPPAQGDMFHNIHVPQKPEPRDMPERPEPANPNQGNIFHHDELVSKLDNALQSTQGTPKHDQVVQQVRRAMNDPAMMRKYPGLSKFDHLKEPKEDDDWRPAFLRRHSNNESYRLGGRIIEAALKRSQVAQIMQSLATVEHEAGRVSTVPHPRDKGAQSNVTRSGQQGQRQSVQGGNRGFVNAVAIMNQQITLQGLAAAIQMPQVHISPSDKLAIENTLNQNNGSMTVQALATALPHIQGTTFGAILFAAERS